MTQNKQYASAWLTIDLAAIADNYGLLKQKTDNGFCQVSGVIKADGYGLGVEKIIAVLENQDCPFYYVATYEEALKIRPLTDKPIAVLGGLFHGAEEDYINRNIIPVLNSLDDIKRWSKTARKNDISLPGIIHFDTGMNRLGLSASETGSIQEDKTLLDGIHVQKIMSHFACADEPESYLNKEQHEKFEKIATHFPNAKKSMANSYGIFLSGRYHFDEVRAGMALYGLNPQPRKDNPMKAVIDLKARILQIRHINKGETIGYGATYKFKNDAVIATLALGYADGFLRTFGNNGNVFYNGIACPLRGRVSMDLISADITHLDNKPQAGDVMEIIGQNQSADDLATAAGTIGYEILTNLGSRYHRNYI